MISICYSGNRAVFEGLLMNVITVAKYTNEPVSIYVLTMDLHEENPKFLPFTDAQISLLNEILKNKNKESQAIKCDVTDLYRTHLRDGINHENGYTPYALLRLLIDQLPDMPEKIIYLDIDTMCCSDIKQFFDIDVENFDFAACKDYMGRFWIRRTYCNSGSILMNLKKIKEDNLFEKCRNMVLKTKMIMPDQTALNKYGKKKYLPFKFNEQRKIKSDTVIKHFCKGIVFFLPFGFHIYNIKQWEREKVHKSLKITMFDDIYEIVDKLKISHKECFE